MLVFWFERKGVGDMQGRLGPHRGGPFASPFTLAGGIQLFFKEGITPPPAPRPVYLLAPPASMVPQFPAFLIYMTAALAETNRPPFDLPEAETELVAGYHTEYSGIKFAMFFLAEYMHMLTISAVGVTLFLGGWHGPMFHVVPWLWPLLWFLFKVYVVVFVLVGIRAT